jgi:platelet-activating factor acetylhydrolase IB subunit beta/gamma
MIKTLALIACLGLMATSSHALEYAYPPQDPQKTGWPLTPEEETFMLKGEHERRPGADSGKYLPHLWPVVPFGQSWGGRAYIDHHAGLVKKVQDNKGPCDVLLVGDSITIQFEKDLAGNENWKTQFPAYKAVNIGVGGDRTQSVLWRLDHGGADGLEPRSIVLMIGNNNMFFVAETGIEAAAQGIKVCVDRLREQFPKVPIVVAKILPCHTPGNDFYENIKKTNAAVDALNLTSDPLVHVVDAYNDLLNADGTIKADLFAPDAIHLSKDGYAVYANKLRPVLDGILASTK